PAGSEETPPAVRVVKPQPGGLQRTVRQPCAVLASESADLSPSVAGVLKMQTVDIGDRRKKGQGLAQIDAPLLDLAEKEASAALQQARGKAAETQARVATAKAELAASKSAIGVREAERKEYQAQAQEYKRRAGYMKGLGAAISNDERM